MPLKLTIELVPETAWFKNVRSEVSQTVWNKIKKISASKSNYRCQICNDTGLNQGYKWPVECHEIWEYIDNKQILKGFISLCPYCHIVKHPGLASIKGNSHIVISQLMKVNNMSRSEAQFYLTKSFLLFEERSKEQWIIDIEYLKKYS